MPAKLDFTELVGMRKHKIEFLCYSYSENGYNFIWVKCDCGVIKLINWDNFKGGKQRTCGCGKYGKYTIGITNHRIYRVWRNMRQRCNNKNNQCYYHYGARGIKVCERWDSFENFYNDVIGEWQPGFHLDRINGLGNYEPSNCRMVLPKINMRNRCDVKLNDEKVAYIRSSNEKLVALAIKFGVTPATIQSVKTYRTWK